MQFKSSKVILTKKKVGKVIVGEQEGHELGGDHIYSM